MRRGLGFLTALAFLLAGCGSAAGTETVTVAGEAGTVTLTDTETVTVTQTVKPVPKPASRAQNFSGNGGKTIRVRVGHDATLGWTNDGDLFQIFDLEGFTWTGVNSQAHRGDTFIPAGRYTLTVNAIGNWTITIR